jgi:hypothetical protein
MADNNAEVPVDNKPVDAGEAKQDDNAAGNTDGK